MRKLTQKFVEKRLLHSNPNSKWVSPPHLVSKARSTGWKFTIHLRLIIKQTFPQSFRLPIIDNENEKASGYNCCTNFDLVHDYWQLLLHPDSKEFQSFTIKDGIYCHRRFPRSYLNAKSHLHSTLSKNMPPKLREVLMLWVDDMVLPEKNANNLLTHIRLVFQQCKNWM